VPVNILVIYNNGEFILYTSQIQAVSVYYCSGVSWSSGRTSTSQRKGPGTAYSCS